jgi:hypothetical protein
MKSSGVEVCMNRRVFILEAGKAVPIVIGALYIVGCGGNSTTSPSATADVQATSTVSNGHSHSANVPASDQLRAVVTTYTTTNVLAHDHQVTLNASQLASLAAGGSVTVTTTSNTVTGVHTHDFTFIGKKS